MKSFQVFLFILKSTFLGFGGGNALMPIIKREVLHKRKWLTLKEFDSLVISTNMIPGPSVVETLSYISIMRLGRFWGSVIALFAILPHVIIALGLLIISQKFLPSFYLQIIFLSVMPVIIGILISFGIRYVKSSRQDLKLPVWLAIFIFTICFSLFIPSPYNIPAFIMIAIILTTFFVSFIKKHRKGK